jgi:hypothetical protein
MAALGWALFGLALAALAAWLLGLGETLRGAIAAGHLLDWVMGGLCLAWLIVLLKAPWDLYFQAQAVAFELDRSRERGIVVAAGREEYVRRLRRRLGWLAIGAHLFSALLVAALAWFAGRAVGYYFAGFYLVSTLFRPTVAGYVYLTHKLRAIGHEARYPREDVVELRERVHWLEITTRTLSEQVDQWRVAVEREASARADDSRELRQTIHAVSRELEASVSRLTDNREVIAGLQAFVRLVAQSLHQGGAALG